MSDKLNELRENTLASVLEDFDGKLDTIVESFNDSDISDEDIETVRAKYRNAFQNFFTTGFDIVFNKGNLGGDQGSNPLSEQVATKTEDYLNLTVTDEDLQKLDDANSRNAFYRKVYPAKCSLLMERALKVQLESSNKLKTNVHAVELIQEGKSEDLEEEVTDNHSVLEISQESSNLRAGIKENLDKLRRLENVEKILLNNQN